MTDLPEVYECVFCGYETTDENEIDAGFCRDCEEYILARLARASRRVEDVKTDYV